MGQSNCGWKLEGMVPELCWYKGDVMSLKKIMYLAAAYYTWAHLSPKYWAAAVGVAFPQL